MLRPATPLAILLFAAFAMLLLAVISTPIIKQIPLGTFEGYSFGVFGYCKGTSCSPIEIGYDTSGIITDSQGATFNLPQSARTTLSAILVVHPVAALFVLIMWVLAIVAHFHSPSHSSRYLLILFIFGIVTFLLCLLCFLIGVVLFVPHMAWGSYIVLAATILVAISGLVSCAMRRTVVSRKARKKRIAENAEMSGENYYNRNAQQEASTVAAAALQPTVPVVGAGDGRDDKLPTFATFEQRKDDRSSDERVPLTAVSPSQRSPNTEAGTGDLSYGVSGPSGSTPSLPARDQYGNPIQTPQDAYGVRRGPSFERMNSRGRGGPPGGYRGRGGYRGGYGGPYGVPQNGRGPNGPPGPGRYGPGPNNRGGYGPRGGYGGGMRGGRPTPPGYNGSDAPYDRRPQDAYRNYGPRRPGSPGPAPMSGALADGPGAGGYEPYNANRESDLPRAESPPPLPDSVATRAAPAVGQAIEMDATTGSPSHPPAGFGQFNQLRDSDADVAGMLALQQARTSAQRHDTYMSEGSKYSQEDTSQYVPVRQAWNQGAGRNSPGVPSPLQLPSRQAGQSNPAADGGNYYEDVDPRFAEAAPKSLRPGPPPADYDNEPQHSGGRSPTTSERSGFTSVSQRGINPRWNPPPPGPPGAYGHHVPRRPVNRNEVNVLNSNPDFQLPGSRGAAGSPSGGRGNGHIPGSAYPAI